MTATLSEFRQRAKTAIEDIRLQGALDGGTGKLWEMRRLTFEELPNSDALRDHFKAIRSATLKNLGEHLETFEKNATAAGANVHWARDGADAREIVISIAQEHGVKLVTKSKSMATEEIHLNEALADVGVEAIETDLGEYIVQLAEETPSHIIAPAIHKTRYQAAELLSRESGRSLSPDDLTTLTGEARKLLRKRFLTAGMGISGGNMIVAETGSVVLVTNEGNARMVTSVPPVHIAVVGIEKIVPTWDAAAIWLSLLARSASGQPLSIYTSVITGPSRSDDPDGTGEVHIVLLDNGRSELVGTKYEEVLQCIRCGACLNVCPVYREAGGHSYDSPYPGPIGAVVTPLLLGRENYEALPHASSLCGACKEVCPVRIDLPRMLLELRADQVAERTIPWRERKAEEAGAFVLKHEKLMRFMTNAARLAQRPFLRNGKLRLPQRLNPVLERQLPALANRSFREIWKSGELEEKR